MNYRNNTIGINFMLFTELIWLRSTFTSVISHFLVKELRDNPPHAHCTQQFAHMHVHTHTHTRPLRRHLQHTAVAINSNVSLRTGHSRHIQPSIQPEIHQSELRAHLLLIKYNNSTIAHNNVVHQYQHVTQNRLDRTHPLELISPIRNRDNRGRQDERKWDYRSFIDCHYTQLACPWGRL